MGTVRHTRRTRMRAIEGFKRTGRVDLACQFAGIARDTHYDWLKTDEEYRRLFEEAREGPVGDMLEDEAVRRGVEGVDRLLVSGGRPVVEKIVEPVLDAEGKPKIGEDGKPETREVERRIYVREYSDRLLELLLKARRRSVFGDKVEATGKDGAPLFALETVRAYMQSVPDDEA